MLPLAVVRCGRFVLSLLASRLGATMKRRDFLTLVGSAAVAWPLAARAERQAAAPVIGILNAVSQEASEARLPAFVRGLSDEGLTVGRNVTIESRWANGNYDLLPRFVADLVGRHAGVIVAGGTEAVARAAQAVSGAVPVVAIMAGDPVARGFVASVNRPGGNLTVVSIFTFDNNALVAKRLDLLHQLVPRATTVGWLANSRILDFEDELREFQGAAATLGLGATFAAVPRADDIEAALLSLVRQGAGALMEAGPSFYEPRAARLPRGTQVGASHVRVARLRRRGWLDRSAPTRPKFGGRPVSMPPEFSRARRRAICR